MNLVRFSAVHADLTITPTRSAGTDLITLLHNRPHSILELIDTTNTISSLLSAARAAKQSAQADRGTKE